MNLSSSLLGALLALTSAAIFGGGDYAGGRAAHRSNQYQALTLAALSGLVLLILAALLWRERFPAGMSILWAVLSGLAGALGLAALYRGLAIGSAALVAPVSAVISAALPVIFDALHTGLPTPGRLAGFALALGGIWLVSSTPDSAPTAGPRRALFHAVLAGVGFGWFFIFLGLIERGIVFTPLVIARSCTLLVGILLLKSNRLPIPGPFSNPLALLAGLLDATGNLLYVLARQFTRLDVAAVLSSLYPASTVLLSAWLLHQKVAPRQGLGLILCLAAIALIVG